MLSSEQFLDPANAARVSLLLATGIAAATAAALAAYKALSPKARTKQLTAAVQPIYDSPEPTATNKTKEPLQSSQDASGALILVDPLSTGANVLDVALRRGYSCIVVQTGTLALPSDPSLRTDALAKFEYDPANPTRLLEAIRALPVKPAAVVAGSELGVECCDWLSEQLGLPSNGTALSEARRDKYTMGEVVRAAGLRAPKQARAGNWSAVRAFLTGPDAPPFPVVIKPSRSAGSDHVYKCCSMSEAQTACNEIFQCETNALGSKNDCVLVQEFISGIEYIVDTVSRDGVHKVVAIWAYDKRQHHGANFVYFGMGAVCGSTQLAQTLGAYTCKVLDAMQVKHGAGHAEVIMTATGPCLVEIGIRPQGCEGTFMPLADLAYGCNQVDALVAAAMGEPSFDSLSSTCPPLHMSAFKVDFVSSVHGRLLRIDHLDTIRSLPSFVRFDLLPEPGSHIMQVTIDCFTACGSVSLAHVDAQQLQRDVERVRELEKTMWVVEQTTTTQAPAHQ